jgi:murein L,D-transpeptidase YcbB/YkuD
MGLAATAVAQEPIDSAVRRFYELRWQQPAWILLNGTSPQANLLLDQVTRATRDGLEPADYVTPVVESLLRRHLTQGDAWVLDSLLTRAFLLYAHDLSTGRVLPAAVDTQWAATAQRLDLATLLNQAADGDAGTALGTIEPPQAGYRTLRTALLRYRAVAQRGGWPITLSERLAAEGYDTTQGIPSAVRQFQQLHGLAVDGIVGAATRAALDVAPETRADQIALNLERWRWLPRALGERYIVVNSAAFTVDLVERDSVAWTTRAIVGSSDWTTPIVSGVAGWLQFRPRWKVPRLIAARELLPLIQRDPAYLRRERFRVFGDSLLRDIELDPTMLDWQAITESTFSYQLVQDPGGDNPLGGVKLVFWNPFTVFIHDTPSRRLFSEAWRTFSHGCVRVEGARQLVGRLLPTWSADSIRAAMTHGGERWVRLPQPVPVHLVYWTAWATDEGLVAFAADPYGWDVELARALQARAAPHVSLKGPTQ